MENIPANPLDNVPPPKAPPFELKESLGGSGHDEELLQADTHVIEVSPIPAAASPDAVPLLQERSEILIDEASLKYSPEAVWRRNKLINVNNLESKRDQFSTKKYQHDMYQNGIMFIIMGLAFGLCIASFLKLRFWIGIPLLVLTLMPLYKVADRWNPASTCTAILMNSLIWGINTGAAVVTTIFTILHIVQRRHIFKAGPNHMPIVTIASFLWLLDFITFSAFVSACALSGSEKMERVINEHISKVKATPYEPLDGPPNHILEKTQAAPPEFGSY